MPEPQSFEQVLQHADLPEPGPGYYEARRRLWLTPLPDLPHRQIPSPAQQKLEDFLNKPNAIHWNKALGRVWRGLSSGGKLKNHLPMNLIIIHASWLRDGTWPAGMEAPSSDDNSELPPSASNPPESIFESTTTSVRMVAKQHRTSRWR